jgi:hypothetical protein
MDWCGSWRECGQFLPPQWIHFFFTVAFRVVQSHTWHKSLLYTYILRKVGFSSIHRSSLEIIVDVFVAYPCGLCPREARRLPWRRSHFKSPNRALFLMKPFRYPKSNILQKPNGFYGGSRQRAKKKRRGKAVWDCTDLTTPLMFLREAQKADLLFCKGSLENAHGKLGVYFAFNFAGPSCLKKKNPFWVLQAVSQKCLQN